MEKIKLAEKVATEKHKGQFRKISGEAYISHPKAVYEKVKKYTDNVDVLCAAWLHDTIEDTDYTYEQCKSDFGQKTADLVREVTSHRDLIEKYGKGPYLAWRAKLMTKEALLIKLSDRIDNLQDLDSFPEDKKESKIEETWKMICSVKDYRDDYWEKNSYLQELCLEIKNIIE